MFYNFYSWNKNSVIKFSLITFTDSVFIRKNTLATCYMGSNKELRVKQPLKSNKQSIEI